MLKNIGIGVGVGVGGVLLVLLWLTSIVASLAVPACAVWALGHFAFGWW